MILKKENDPSGVFHGKNLNAMQWKNAFNYVSYNTAERNM